MKLKILGCGDAFGSGGRLQTSYLLDSGGERALLDCGATVMVGLARERIDPNSVATIFISHLHGDHFSGLVWWLMHAQHVARRKSPLTVIGPPGVARRVVTASEALFPTSSLVPLRFELRFMEYVKEAPTRAGAYTVTPFEVSHPSGAMSFALRIEAGGRTLAFSGDTEWVDSLFECARAADLFIAECYGYETDVPYHMSWKVIASKLDRISARRIMLTHMSDEMLEKGRMITDSRILLAEDGLSVDV
jgi:ribonuclease BN (tRNA processing enzyme)